MNERVKELMAQAKAEIRSEEEIEGVAYDDFDGRVMAKFAELIILECEKVAKDPQWYGESPSNGWRNPINHVCKVMKAHFGVEE